MQGAVRGIHANLLWKIIQLLWIHVEATFIIGCGDSGYPTYWLWNLIFNDVKVIAGISSKYVFQGPHHRVYP